MPPLCPRCGKPQINDNICSGCIDRKTSIDGIRSPFRFEGVIRTAIHQFKYSNLKLLAGTLSSLLHNYITENPIPFDVLVPVPLHPQRLRERGYNQSFLLARNLGKLAGLPVEENGLSRTRRAMSQARSLSVEERRRNVQGAFACNNERMRDRKILLIDDVSTSGATLDACASALKAGGAASVWGLTIAREL
jgi:ComF family protein